MNSVDDLEEDMNVYSKGNRPIVISNYDDRWPDFFAEEKARILSGLPFTNVWVEHIGSTSIPNLPSKPIIDIGLGIDSLANAPACITVLTDSGYVYEPDYEKALPTRRFLWKGTPVIHTHHISIMEKGSEIWRHNLRFRDYLRTHPDDAADYATLKRKLASVCVDDFGRYVEGKTEFVESIQKKAKAARNGE